ncbi:unnamed protein product [Calypogeia fissa]
MKFLLGDLDGARNDGAMALDLMHEYKGDEVLNSPSLGEKSVMYLNLSLVNRREDDEVWQQMELSHFQVFDKVRVSDFQGALACWDVMNSVIDGSHVTVFFLQERGILKRLAGDLRGSLEDHSAALEIYGRADSSESEELKYCAYNCLKHRGFVKSLVGDMDGAQKDGMMAVKLISCDGCYPSERLILPNLGEELLTYMHFKLHRTLDRGKQKKVRAVFRNDVMEKMRDLDFSGALATWENFDAAVSAYFDRVFFLQERGVLKRLAGDLLGAWDDLTFALEILSEGDENCCVFRCSQYRYNCLKNLGYVNFLLGDLGRAQDDGTKALKLLWNKENDNRKISPHLSGSLGEQSVVYLHFRLIGIKDANSEDVVMKLRYSQVMEKVTALDFVGALAVWFDFDAKVSGYYNRVYFLQERRILKRMTGDLDGALEDLTAALEMGDDNYELLKHRAYIKHLMGDGVVARRDAERCMAMEPMVAGPECLGGLSVAFSNFRLKGSKSYEDELMYLSHAKVMEEVKEKEFLGGLAIWENFDAMLGCHDRVYFLQERGILKRMLRDLKGALEDLTEALEINGHDYECSKHRGYVKFLLGDIDGARNDAKKCVAMGLKQANCNFLGGYPVAFLEFKL